MQMHNIKDSHTMLLLIPQIKLSIIIFNNLFVREEEV